MWLSYFHSLYSYLTAPTSPCHDVAIVGGGIVGCSLAYHLAANNQTSSIHVIDRESIGSGATGLSAATLYTTLTNTSPPPLQSSSDLTKALDVTQTRDLDARLVACNRHGMLTADLEPVGSDIPDASSICGSCLRRRPDLRARFFP